MEAPQIDPAWLAHGKIAFASLCGGITRLLFRPATGDTMAQSLLRTGWLLFGCVTCGYYGTTPVMDWFGMESVTYAGAIGALLGFLGLSIAEGLLKAADAFDFREWLSRMGATK